MSTVDGGAAKSLKVKEEVNNVKLIFLKNKLDTHKGLLSSLC
jgi:hypothetical protein